MDGYSRKCLGGAVQIGTDAVHTDDTRVIGQHRDPAALCRGDLPVNEQLFHTFAAAGKTKAVAALSAPQEDFSHRTHRECVRGVAQLLRRPAGYPVFRKFQNTRNLQNHRLHSRFFRQDLQPVIAPGNGDPAGFFYLKSML